MTSHPSPHRRAAAFLLSCCAFVLSVFALITCFTGRPGTPASDHKPGQGENSQQLEEQRQQLLEKADTLRRGYFYDEALELLENADKKLVNDDVKQAIETCQQDKDSLVKYEGMPYHVFFHSLIIYPELAFDNEGHPAEGYNMWMTTVSEFKKMLPLLLENDFVLYDINELIQVNEDGSVTQKDIYLPQGKKPLILSVDDLSYYDYMAPDGFATRLVINEQGDVVTEVKAPDGTVSNTYDGDVQPIVDQFVKEHPEFSFRGAKGILAPTGYQGAFGYRITDLELYTPEEGQQILEPVVN